MWLVPVPGWIQNRHVGHSLPFLQDSRYPLLDNSVIGEAPTDISLAVDSSESLASLPSHALLERNPSPRNQVLP